MGARIEMKNITPLTNDLKALNEEDFINEILYLIYKLNGDSKYSTISELIYVLGKDNLFKLCSVFGGCEIKVPTLLELKLFIGAIYVYFVIHNDGGSFEKAFKDLNLDTSMKKVIYNIYSELENVNDQP